MPRGQVFSPLILACALLSTSSGTAGAETVVRYGISLADVPLTTGQDERMASAER